MAYLIDGCIDDSNFPYKMDRMPLDRIPLYDNKYGDQSKYEDDEEEINDIVLEEREVIYDPEKK